jgi:hypothetical protein
MDYIASITCIVCACGIAMASTSRLVRDGVATYGVYDGIVFPIMATYIFGLMAYVSWPRAKDNEK